MKSFLKQKILNRPDKRITFCEYMDDCLYHPRFGYYMKTKPKIGKEGDYYTSSSVHPVFAETLAHFTVKVFQRWQRPVRFCEMGAGTGRFARQFMDTLAEQHPSVYRGMEYLLLEKSPYHRQQQQKNLRKHAAHVRWLDDFHRDLLQGKGYQGVLFSNELMDAFPVHLLEKQEGKLLEVGVAWNEAEEKLEETLFPLENERIHQYLQKYGFSLTEGQRFEVPLAAEQWFAEVSRWIQEGLWLTVDYGYTNEEIMLPQYRRGSLLCYDRHQRDERPLERPGEKDITAHVHFDVLAEAARTEGWKKVNLFPQAEFLMTAGILEHLQDHGGGDPFLNEASKKNRAIRQLITPQGIGGAFHVLTLVKGVPKPVLDLLHPFSFSQINRH